MTIDRETAGFFETAVNLYQIVQRHIPGDGKLFCIRIN